MSSYQTIRCPHCQNTLQIAQRFETGMESRSVVCPHCQLPIRPGQSASTRPGSKPATATPVLLTPYTATTSPQQNAPTYATPPDSHTRSNRGLFALIAILVGSVSFVLLFAVVGLAWYWMSTSRPGQARDIRDLQGAELERELERQWAEEQWIQQEQQMMRGDQPSGEPEFLPGKLNPNNAR